MTKQYSAEDIHVGNGEYYFCEDLVDNEQDIFPNHKTNYKVQQDLIDAGVLIDTNIGQSGGNVRVVFKSMSDGWDFVERLNAYIKRMTDLM